MRNLKKLCLAWIIIFPAQAGAQATSIQLQLPPTFLTQICPAPLWNQLPVEWQGTIDRRPESAVGWESKREGKDAVAVMVEPPLTELIDGKLREIFSNCGMKLGKEPATIQLSAVVENFSAEFERGIIFGKGKAKSRIRILMRSPVRQASATLGYELEFKNTKKKSLHRLTEALNEVLLKSLEQIPKSEELRSLGKSALP